MRVNDLLRLHRQGLADTVLASKVRSANAAYNDFSLDELGALERMGLPDSIVQAMLESTAAAAKAREEKAARDQLSKEIASLRERLDAQEAARELMAEEGFSASSAALAGAKIDVQASELRWLPEDFDFDTPEEEAKAGKKLRKDLANGLEALLPGGGEGSSRARYRLVVHENGSRDYAFLPCLVLLTYFGCPLGNYSAKVELELEVGGRRYQAEGTSSEPVFLYTENAEGGGSRAVAKAVVDALRKIDAQAAAPAEGKPAVPPKSPQGAAAP